MTSQTTARMGSTPAVLQQVERSADYEPSSTPSMYLQIPKNITVYYFRSLLCYFRQHHTLKLICSFERICSFRNFHECIGLAMGSSLKLSRSTAKSISSPVVPLRFPGNQFSIHSRNQNFLCIFHQLIPEQMYWPNVPCEISSLFTKVLYYMLRGGSFTVSKYPFISFKQDRVDIIGPLQHSTSPLPPALFSRRSSSSCSCQKNMWCLVPVSSSQNSNNAPCILNQAAILDLAGILLSMSSQQTDDDFGI